MELTKFSTFNFTVSTYAKTLSLRKKFCALSAIAESESTFCWFPTALTVTLFDLEQEDIATNYWIYKTVEGTLLAPSLSKKTLTLIKECDAIIDSLETQGISLKGIGSRPHIARLLRIYFAP